jgi:hypothetical protein
LSVCSKGTCYSTSSLTSELRCDAVDPLSIARRTLILRRIPDGPGFLCRNSALDWLLFKERLDPVWRGQGLVRSAAIVEVSADRGVGLADIVYAPKAR